MYYDRCALFPNLYNVSTNIQCAIYTTGMIRFLYKSCEFVVRMSPVWVVLTCSVDQ